MFKCLIVLVTYVTHIILLEVHTSMKLYYCAINANLSMYIWRLPGWWKYVMLNLFILLSEAWCYVRYRKEGAMSILTSHGHKPISKLVKTIAVTVVQWSETFLIRGVNVTSMLDAYLSHANQIVLSADVQHCVSIAVLWT